VKNNPWREKLLASGLDLYERQDSLLLSRTKIFNTESARLSILFSGAPLVVVVGGGGGRANRGPNP
jgi:hypothetical protein